VAESRDELAIGEVWGRLAGDVAMAPVVLVALTDVALQAFAGGTRTEDEEVVVRYEAARDVLDELTQVLEAMGLTGGLRRSAAPVAHGGIVPDVAGGAVVSWHLRVHPLQSCFALLPLNDDGLARVDPHERSASCHFVAGPPVHE